MKPKPKKSLLILCATLGIVTISGQKARAESFFPDSIDSIFEQVQQVLELINIDIPGLDFWAKEVLEDPCADSPVIFIVSPEPGYCQRTPVGSIPEQIYESSQTGALGIPNPNEVRTGIERDMSEMSGTDFSDAFDLNAVNLAVTYANSAERGIARQFIESTLGQAGQENSKKELDEVTRLLETVAEQTKKAQESESTQGAVKMMAANQYAFQQSLSAIQAHLVNQEHLTAVQLGLSANVSGSLDRFEKYYRAKSATDTSSLLKRSSQTTLF